MNKLGFREMFNKGHLESRSEVTLAAFIGRELGRRGMVLDLSDVTLDESNLSETQLLILHHQVKAGNILYTHEITGYLSEIDLSDDLSYLDGPDYVYTTEDGHKLVWTREYAKENYKNFYAISKGINSTYLQYAVVAKHIIDCALGLENRLLTLSFTYSESETVKYYNWLEDVFYDYPKLREILEIDTQLADMKSDFSNHMFHTQTRGTDKTYSILEKFEQSQKLGIVKGAICVLWTRSGYGSDGSWGKIKQRVLIRVDDISVRGIRYTTIPEPYTREERYTEYSKINEDRRINYSDIINMKLTYTRSSHDLTNVAFGHYIGKEEHFVEAIDTSKSAEIKVTIPDSAGEPSASIIEMGAHEAIYWILRQYEVEFDTDLYKKMYYSDNKVPFFDVLSWEVYSKQEQEETI